MNKPMEIGIIKEEISAELKKILGDDAYNYGNMQVSSRVTKLVKAVYYLVIQIEVTGNSSDKDARMGNVKTVLSNTKEILSKEN